jgi:hypothetical protein
LSSVAVERDGIAHGPDPGVVGALVGEAEAEVSLHMQEFGADHGGEFLHPAGPD